MLKFLELTNFRSFAGYHRVDFLPNTLTVVQGENVDTQGESASGKSSLLLAIAYALGICPYSQKDLQHWGTEDPMQVVLGLDLGADYILKRGKGVSIEGPEGVVTGAKEVEAFICQKTGLNLDQLAFVLYKAQGENVYFLDKTNSEKRDFLAHVLGLEKFEIEILNNNSLLAQEEQALTKNDSVHTVFQQQKAKVSKDLQLLTQPVAPTPPVVDAAFEAEHQLALERFSALEAEVMEVNSTTAQQLADLHETFIKQEDSSDILQFKEFLTACGSNLETARTNLQAIEIQKRGLEDALAGLKGLQQRTILLKQELASVQKALDLLKIGQCYVCSQPWSSVEKESTLELTKSKLVQEIQEINDKINEETSLKEQLSVQNTQKLSVEQALTEIQNKYNGIAVELDLAQKRQKAFYTQTYNEIVQKQKSANAKVATAQAALDILKNRDLQNKQAQAQFLQAQARYEKQLVEHDTKLGLYNKEIQSLNKKLSESIQIATNLNFSIAYYKDRSDFLKTFLNYIFVDILNEISEEANAYLRSIPNAETITVSFASERSTAKGNLKQEVVALVTVNGQPRSFKAGCSGGQQTTLRLVVELAVRNVLQRRCGKVWGCLLIDEQFQGLDLISKAACMQVLQDFAKNHVVLAIEHDTVINASARHVLKVLKKGGVSSICTDF